MQSNTEDNSAYMKGVSKTGIPISWYRDIQDVPTGKELACLATGMTSFLHLQLLIMRTFLLPFTMDRKVVNVHASSCMSLRRDINPFSSQF